MNIRLLHSLTKSIDFYQANIEGMTETYLHNILIILDKKQCHNTTHTCPAVPPATKVPVSRHIATFRIARRGSSL